MKKNTVVKLLQLVAVYVFVISTANAQGTITIDHKTQRYIGDQSTFDRGKYLTFHAFFRKNDPDFEQFKKQYNIAPEYQGARMFNSPAAKHKQGKYPKIKKKHSGVREVVNYVSTGHPTSIFYKKGIDYSTEDISSI